MTIEQLFFDLIRVTVGTQSCLSRLPSNVEWTALYNMAMKQSLVGVCFAGLQRLGADADEGFARICMSEMQYLTWMGMAAKIQQRNQVIDERCANLQKQLSAEGITSRVLKGQGIANLYSEHLRGLRQSGDIDLWMITSKEKVVAWADAHGVAEPAGYLHVRCQIFDDTEVELHYRPTYMRSLRHNIRLQKFCEEHKSDYQIRENIVVPSWDFDVVYQLSHIYRHLFGLGIGLRQLMDYYFLLVSVNDRESFQKLPLTLSRLGLQKFAGAVMYVMREVFHMEEQYMICLIDERRGQMLLKRIMQTGNFGKMDKVQKEARSTTGGSLIYKFQQWWQLVRMYPEETLSAPLWSIIRKCN